MLLQGFLGRNDNYKRRARRGQFCGRMGESNGDAGGTAGLRLPFAYANSVKMVERKLQTMRANENSERQAGANAGLNIGLNAGQRAAVEHGDGPLLVVAGAGTGKTRVIIERIRNLLETNPDLAGESILGLTFTDKAAGEMKYRVVKAVGERAEGVWLSTFHKFCLEKILQTASPETQPLEDLEHWILLRKHIGELGLVHFRRLQEPGEFLNDFVTFFSRC